MLRPLVAAASSVAVTTLICAQSGVEVIKRSLCDYATSNAISTLVTSASTSRAIVLYPAGTAAIPGFDDRGGTRTLTGVEATLQIDYSFATSWNLPGPPPTCPTENLFAKLLSYPPGDPTAFGQQLGVNMEACPDLRGIAGTGITQNSTQGTLTDQRSLNPLDFEPGAIVRVPWDGQSSSIVTQLPSPLPGVTGTLTASLVGTLTIEYLFDGPDSPWTDLGGERGDLSGLRGNPILRATGSPEGGMPFSIKLENAPILSQCFLLVGTQALDFPVAGCGVIVPDIQTGILLTRSTNAAGERTISGTWPTDLPAGTELFFQYWVVNASAGFEVTGSNGLRAQMP